MIQIIDSETSVILQQIFFGRSFWVKKMLYKDKAYSIFAEIITKVIKYCYYYSEKIIILILKS